MAGAAAVWGQGLGLASQPPCLAQAFVDVARSAPSPGHKGGLAEIREGSCFLCKNNICKNNIPAAFLPVVSWLDLRFS